MDLEENATDAAILKMIKETGGEKYENCCSLNQSLTFTAAKKEFSQYHIAFGEQQKRTLHIINAEKQYTNLALLLSDQCEHTIKAAVFQGTSKNIFRDRTEFKGSLFTQLEDAYTFLDKNNNVHSDYNKLRRIDTRSYPPEALREALLNAIVHRDYSFSASTLISLFDDRLEILSLGGLPKGVTYNDLLLGVSIPRNESLADIFYRLTLIEAFGTGIPKIFESYKPYNLKPKIEISDNAIKITLPNIYAPSKEVFDTPSDTLVINTNYSYADSVLHLFSNADEITRLDVQTTLSVSQATAVRILTEMVTNGQLFRTGRGKNTSYQKTK